MNKKNQNDIDRVYFEKSNKFVLMTTIAIYIFSTIAAYERYASGARTFNFVLLMGGITLIMGLGGLYLIKKDASSQKLPWLFVVLFAISYISTTAASELASTLTMLYPATILLVIYRNRKLMAFQIVSTVIGVIAFVIKNIGSKNIAEMGVILLIVLLFVPIATYISKSLRQLNEQVLKTMDEVNEQKANLEKMIVDLKEVSEEVQSNSEELKTVVNEFAESTLTVNGSIKEISSGAKNTAHSIQEESHLIDNINMKIENVSKSTTEVKRCSEEAEEAVINGTEYVNMLSEKSTYIIKKNNDVSRNMKELESKSADIASITNVISEIANRTNLLALNASIEAARAGEAGRGFAVVAEEISKLAEEARINAGSIESILAQLQNDTKESVKNVAELVEETKAQNEIVNNTAQSFNSIKESINTVKEEIVDVQTQVKEVIDANDKIQTSITSLSSISEETLAVSEESIEMSSESLKKVNTLEEIRDKIYLSMQELEKHFN